MARLYTYCIPVDDGAAPNPYWGVCTLNICKPAIRRVASVGDWVVGFGSKNSPIGDIGTCVVYAMRVTKIMTMKNYDAYCKSNLPGKIPDWTDADLRRRLGDSVYDFSSPTIGMRTSVHSERDRKRDLGGERTLLSEHFYYFGDKPVQIVENLLPIIKNGRGHRSKENDTYVADFVRWIEGFGCAPGILLGSPQKKITIGSQPGCSSDCSTEDTLDECA